MTGCRKSRRSSTAHLARVAAGFPAENAHAEVVVLPHRSRKARIVAADAWSVPWRRKVDSTPSGRVQATGLRFASKIMRPVVAGNRLA